MNAALAAGPLADVLDEARRLGTAFEQDGIRARLLGGAGVALHAHGPIPEPFRRRYGDLDFVVARADAPAFRRALVSAGYEPNARFNAVHGHKRLLYYDTRNGRQVDAFVGDFKMCHALALDDRLPPSGPSLAPADLLLTKLQVFEVNDKDLVDVLVLLREHDVGGDEPELIDRSRLASVVGKDWGWYTTVGDNLVKVARRASVTEGIDEATRATLIERVAALRAVFEDAPKSLAWRARARVGRRMPWYELPEEIAGR